MGKADLFRRAMSKLKRPAMLTGAVGAAGYIGDTLTNPETGEFDADRLANMDTGWSKIVKNWTTPKQRNSFYDAGVSGFKAMRGFDGGVFNLGKGLHSLVRSFSDPKADYRPRLEDAAADFGCVPGHLSNLGTALHGAAGSLVVPGPDDVVDDNVQPTLEQEAAKRLGLTWGQMKDKSLGYLDQIAKAERIRKNGPINEIMGRSSEEVKENPDYSVEDYVSDGIRGIGDELGGWFPGGEDPTPPPKSMPSMKAMPPVTSPPEASPVNVKKDIVNKHLG